MLLKILLRIMKNTIPIAVTSILFVVLYPVLSQELVASKLPVRSQARLVPYLSSPQEEVMVWDSGSACQKVVQAGGRMAIATDDKLQVATWNIRRFPLGQLSNRAQKPNLRTDISWLACSIAWMNVDVLAVQESLATAEAKQAWEEVLRLLEGMTGASWRWMPQRCGGMKIGFLWNAKRVEVQQVKSLKAFNVRAQSPHSPCAGGLRPGLYGYVQSLQKPGVDFHLIALHLKSGSTVFALEERQKALNRIDKTMKPFLFQDKDIVILGDFNTMGAGDYASRKSELKYMRRMVSKEKPGFQDLLITPRCSHYFRGRGGWLDHILVNHGMEEVRTRSVRVTGYCAIAQCQRIKGDYPLAYEQLSDHCPVVIDIANQDQD